MDGISIRIKRVGRDLETYVVKPRNIVEFEQKFGKGLNDLLIKEQRLDQLYWLAHNVIKHQTGEVMKPYSNEWTDELEGAEVFDTPLESAEKV